jgi:hypothetical protein
VVPLQHPCEECEETVPRRDRARKRRAHRANKSARLDRLLDSILTPTTSATAMAGTGSLLNMLQPLRTTGVPSEGRLDWSGMGATCDPFRLAPRLAGTACGQRKRESIAAFAWLLEQVILPCIHESRAALPADRRSSYPVIVDAGCSTGSLVLPLAHAFPEAHFVGIDVKASSLALLRDRAAAAGLSDRISTWEGRIEEYDGPCDALVSLHACGGASDAALMLAAERAPQGHRAAPFAVSPCCVGALPFGNLSLGGKKGGSHARQAASIWLEGHLQRVAAAEVQLGAGEGQAAATATATVQATAGAGVDTGADTSTEEERIAAQMFSLLAASAGADGSIHQGGVDEDDSLRTVRSEAMARQRRSKRVVEIDRLAAMPGEGLGGSMLRIRGEATEATSSLTDVLVGPPSTILHSIMCAS